MPYEKDGNLITNIKINKNTVSLYINKEKFVLDKNTFSSFYLYKGKNLSKKEVKEIKDNIALEKTNKYLLSLLNKKMYTEYELRKKLYQKNLNKYDVDKLISSFKEKGLINDKEYVNSYIEHSKGKKIGYYKIIESLKEKGIKEEILKDIVIPFNVELEKATSLLKVLEKKYQKYPYSSKCNEIYSYLLSKGYQNEIASIVSNKIKRDTKVDNSLLSREIRKTYDRLNKKYQGYELKKRIIKSLIAKGYEYKEILKEMEKVSLYENDF